MSGGIRTGIAAAILVVPWALMGGNGEPSKPKPPAPPPNPPPRPNRPNPPAPPKATTMLEFAHTSLAGCGETIEWVPLGNSTEWLVTADALWRADGGLERFRPTPTWEEAIEFADLHDADFPTSELSDLAWSAATVKLAPLPLDIHAGDMMGEAFAILENRLIEHERAGRGGLIATVGKDYIFDRSNHPGMCTIYGWHRLTGEAIQGVNSHSHNAVYHDYSHHPRLVKRRDGGRFNGFDSNGNLLFR